VSFGSSGRYGQSAHQGTQKEEFKYSSGDAKIAAIEID